MDVPKPEDSDHYYLRWLRARKFNVKKAEEMLRKVTYYGMATTMHSYGYLVLSYNNIYSTIER